MKQFNKTNSFSRLILLLLILSLAACKKGFLDKTPKDSLPPENFFNTASDLRIYVNGMYDADGSFGTRIPIYQFTGTSNNGSLDVGSDFLINSNAITPALNQISANGLAGLGTSNDSWAIGFRRIRQDNYLFHYALPKVEKTPNADHYLGEAYFFRAWDYFTMLKLYGDLPILTDLTPQDDVANLYAPRQSRNEVAKQIIKDLDLAIAKLYWKGQGEAVAGRVNKESAIVLKSRVALYEGSWEYYHGRKNSPFAVQGKDGKEFLELIEPAMQQLITNQGTRIFRTGTEPYNQLFAQSDMSTVDGAFFYRVYDGSKLNVSHSFYNKVADGGPSITDHLSDMYLNKDGSPQAVPASYGELNTLSTSLDPRFRQTIWTPDRGPLGKIPGRNTNPNLRYPIIAPILSASAGFTSTGYRIWKGAVFNSNEATKGETDDLLVRYEEGLLNLAEAKAILGTLNQGDVDKTINVIRDRVGMTRMNLGAISGFPSSAYKEELGFSAADGNVVNEVRRERSVELALEGFRIDDIKRWAVYEKVVNGYMPKGAQLQEFLNYFNDPEKLTADGFNISGIVFPLLTNNNSRAFENGRINPYFRSPQFSAGGQGFFIDPNRDYLTFVPLGQIQLYKAQANVTLTQNPGWK